MVLVPFWGISDLFSQTQRRSGSMPRLRLAATFRIPVSWDCWLPSYRCLSQRPARWGKHSRKRRRADDPEVTIRGHDRRVTIGKRGETSVGRGISAWRSDDAEVPGDQGGLGAVTRAQLAEDVGQMI